MTPLDGLGFPKPLLEKGNTVSKNSTKLSLVDSKTRANRLVPQGPCIVQAKTIGTTLAFNLPLENFSRTGLLLSSGPYQRLPFQVNTICELTVDPQNTTFEQPLTLLAKIVRLKKEGGKTSHFGLQLLPLEVKDSYQWHKNIDALERQEH